MKLFLFFLVYLVFLNKVDCRNKQSENKLLKGRLEVKGICMNYTIAILEGKTDNSLIVALWTDETTGKSYKNVFALGSPCTFPDSISQGDEFYFSIDPEPKRDCSVCLAYYPKPEKSLGIKVMPRK